jgi:hypothetical protein
MGNDHESVSTRTEVVQAAKATRLERRGSIADLPAYGVRIADVKSVALAAVLVGWLSTMPTSVGSGQIWRSFENPRLDHKLRIPPTWRPSVRPADGVSVITSVAVPNRNDNPERIKLPRGGVSIWIFDYGRVSGDVPARPRRIELGREEIHSCGFGEGYAPSFRDHGRLFHVFVKLGPYANRAVVLAVLNSIRAKT